MLQVSEPDAADVEPVPDDALTPHRFDRFQRRRLLTKVSIQSKLVVMMVVVHDRGRHGGRDHRLSGRPQLASRLGVQPADRSARVAGPGPAGPADGPEELDDRLHPRGHHQRTRSRRSPRGSTNCRASPSAPAQSQSITDYYNNGFIKEVEQYSDDKLDVAQLLPTSNAQRYLQANYTAQRKSDDVALTINDAHDGSAWSAANAQYQDFFREIVNRFEFEDALLLDAGGNVVYSAYKDVDLGTNILAGPYSGSKLRGAFEQALSSNALDYVGFTDFEIYQPAENVPTAWMVTPIVSDGRAKGVLALQFPATKINRLMTFDKQWGTAGLGATGETYLVGPDGLMRSDSRLFLRGSAGLQTRRRPGGHSRRRRRSSDPAGRHHPGATRCVASHPGRRPRSVRDADHHRLPRQRVAAGVCAAGDPRIPTSTGPSSRRSTPRRPSRARRCSPGPWCSRPSASSSSSVIAAVFLAQLFVRPIRRLEAGARRISAGDYNVVIPVETRDEIGDLTMAFNEMSRSLTVKEELLNEQRKENDQLLGLLMPEPVAARYRQGEEIPAEEHQDVTVIFVDVIGLDRLQAELTSERWLTIVDELERQFDAAGDGLGMERIRSVRNGYLGSCGLNVPRLDNVRTNGRLRAGVSADHRPVQRRDEQQSQLAGGGRHRHGQQRTQRSPLGGLRHVGCGGEHRLSGEKRFPPTWYRRHRPGVRSAAGDHELHCCRHRHGRRAGAAELALVDRWWNGAMSTDVFTSSWFYWAVGIADRTAGRTGGAHGVAARAPPEGQLPRPAGDTCCATICSHSVRCCCC